uniref:Protein kinase domain-containing protein n=1 Tax=Rhabditophanes sp. KR3021 TaxID=114890 RepID=A0AC35TNI4_9BILA
MLFALFSWYILENEKRGFSYIVLQIAGPDLMRLRMVERSNKYHVKRCGSYYSEETALRIGIAMLYQIKQVHSVGYLHRDVKPGNMVICNDQAKTRHLFVIDYGMVRRFVCDETEVATNKLNIELPDGIQSIMRPPRREVFLRGTTITAVSTSISTKTKAELKTCGRYFTQ